MALFISSHGRSGICVAIPAVRGRAARSSLATSRADMEAAQQSVDRGSSRCSAGWGRRTVLGLPPGLREPALRLPSGPREPALRSPSGPRVKALGPPTQKGAEGGSTHAAVGATRAGAPVDVGAARGVARATAAVGSGESHHLGRRRGRASRHSSRRRGRVCRRCSGRRCSSERRELPLRPPSGPHEPALQIRRGHVCCRCSGRRRRKERRERPGGSTSVLPLPWGRGPAAAIAGEVPPWIWSCRLGDRKEEGVERRGSRGETVRDGGRGIFPMVGASALTLQMAAATGACPRQGIAPPPRRAHPCQGCCARGAVPSHRAGAFLAEGLPRRCRRDARDGARPSQESEREDRRRGGHEREE